VTYNSVWASELSLWRHTVTVDSESAFSWSQLGSAEAQAGNWTESIAAYDRSLAVAATPLAYLGQARNFLERQNFDQAISLARRALDTRDERINAYTLFRAYEVEAVALTSAGRADEAERSLRAARVRLPIYSAALTEKLAVALYQQNRKSEAMRELEAARDQARRELLPASKMVFLRLGMLHAEMGNDREAAAYLREYLRYTNGSADAQAAIERKRAAEMLSKMSQSR
jgi:tetratricopeptide (TPR) repeat protein